MKILLTISILLQAATLFLVFVNSMDIDRLSREVTRYWLFDKSDSTGDVICDTIGKGHPSCGWRIRELKDGE